MRKDPTGCRARIIAGAPEVIDKTGIVLHEDAPGVYRVHLDTHVVGASVDELVARRFLRIIDDRGRVIDEELYEDACSIALRAEIRNPYPWMGLLE